MLFTFGNLKELAAYLRKKGGRSWPKDYTAQFIEGYERAIDDTATLLDIARIDKGRTALECLATAPRDYDYVESVLAAWSDSEKSMRYIVTLAGDYRWVDSHVVTRFFFDPATALDEITNKVEPVPEVHPAAAAFEDPRR
jgi:hypothetical protein